MSRKLKASVAQLGPIHLADTRGQVVTRLMAMMREAHAAGARFVVFPELALTTFFPRYWMTDQKEIDRFFEREVPGPETRPLFDLAAQGAPSSTPPPTVPPPAVPSPLAPTEVPGAQQGARDVGKQLFPNAPKNPLAAPEPPAPAEGGGDTRGLDQDIQGLKKDVVDLNKDLFMLEEELLFPANTQVAVFLSMDVGQFFALDSVTLKIDQKEVINYLYTPREVEALLSVDAGRVPPGAIAFFPRDPEANQRRVCTFFALVALAGGIGLALGTHNRVGVALLALVGVAFAVGDEGKVAHLAVDEVGQLRDGALEGALDGCGDTCELAPLAAEVHRADA